MEIKKFIFLDFDGTLFRMKTDYVSMKKEMGVTKVDIYDKSSYEIITKYEMDTIDKAILIFPPPYKEDFEVVIVSRNGSKCINYLLNKFKMEYRVLCRDNVEFIKPDKRHIESLGGYHLDSLMIGDRKEDEEFAQKLGIKYYSSIYAFLSSDIRGSFDKRMIGIPNENDEWKECPSCKAMMKKSDRECCVCNHEFDDLPNIELGSI